MKFKKNRTARVFSAILLLLLIGDLCSRIIYNHQLERKFPAINLYGETQYREGVPMEEMDFSRFHRFLNNNVLAADVAMQETITLQEDLTYFQVVDGEMAPVLTIPAGTEVYWRASPDYSYGIQLGYGAKSYPTYEKGWRYACPFVAVGETDREQEYYYVRLEDLKTAMRPVLKISSLKKALWDRKITGRQYLEQYILGIDEVFYEKGIYLSPDLEQDIWLFRDTLLLLGFICLNIRNLINRFSARAQS